MTIRDAAGSLHGSDGKYTLDPKAKGNAAALGADTVDQWSTYGLLHDGEIVEDWVENDEGLATSVTYQRNGSVVTAVAHSSPLPPTSHDVHPSSYVQEYRNGYTDAVDARLQRHRIRVSDTQQFIGSWHEGVQADITSEIPFGTPPAEIQDRVLRSIEDGHAAIESISERIAMWDKHSGIAEGVMSGEFYRKAYDWEYSHEDVPFDGEELDPTLFEFDSETRQRVGHAISDNLDLYEMELHDIVAFERNGGKNITIDDVRRSLARSTVEASDATSFWEQDVEDLASTSPHRVLRDQSPAPYIDKNGTGAVTWE